MFVWRMRLNVFKCIQTVRYSQGDVIGCHIELPEVPGQDYLPPTFKEIISPYENTKSDFLQRIEDFFFFLPNPGLTVLENGSKRLKMLVRSTIKVFFSRKTFIFKQFKLC